MSWYKALFSFNGRLNRRGFWIGFGIHFLFLFMVAMWINLAELSLLSVLPLIITGFSLSAIIIKRLHDRNRSAKALLMALVPIICYLAAPYSQGIMQILLGQVMPAFIGMLLF